MADPDGRAQFVDRVALLVDRYGDEPFAQYQGDWFGWSDVGNLQQTIASAFDLLEIDASSTVALVARSRPWCLAASLAALGLGRTQVLVSPVQSDRTLAAELIAIGAGVVVTDGDDHDRAGVAAAIDTAGSVSVLLGSDRAAVRPPDGGAHHGTRSSVRRGGLSVSSDAGIVMLTSGTTGPPKRVPVRWNDLAAGGGAASPREPGSRRGAAILALPLTSVGGVFSIASTVFGGRPLALMDRFDVSEWAALIREHRPRRMGAPPSVVSMILDADIPAAWLDSVETYVTASAPLPLDAAAELEARYDLRVVQGYGATEFLGSVTGWPGDLHDRMGDAKRGSVGVVLPGFGLRVVDPDTGRVLPAGEVGVIEVDAPRRATDLPDGWVRTADRGQIDTDGFVWIAGRIDDVIIRGGFKVDCSKVASTLRSHPDVTDAYVVGLPDRRLGEVPGAVVVVGSSRAGPEELRRFAHDRLAPYEVPTTVLVIEQIPTTTTMKVDRGAVRDLLSER